MAKTKSKTSGDSKPAIMYVPRPEFAHIPTDLISFSPTNPRKQFDDIELQELATSLKLHGMIQPVGVKIDADGYELIYGERRVRAALIAGLEEIPANVYPEEVPSDLLLEIQIIENLQRKNINPMEESDAFAMLVDKKIDTAEQIADKLGVSTKYVYDRLALQKVIPDVQDKIRDGVLSITYGKQFARLKKEDQEKLWENWASNIDEQDISIGDLKREIKNAFSLNLEDAIFSTTDAKLVPKAGSCDKCQKRSGCNLLLFDDIQQDDICFDKACFQKKEQAHLDKMIKDLEKAGKKVVRISGGYMGLVELPEGVIGYSDWSECSEENSHAIGVVTFSSPNSYKQLGDSFPVRLTSMHQDSEDPEFEDEGPDEGSESDHVGTSNGKSRVDHDDVIVLRLWELITEKFNNDPAFKPDLSEMLRNRIERNFHSLDEQNLEKVCELCDFPILKDQESNLNTQETINAIIQNCEDLPRLYLLTDLVSDIELGNTWVDKEFVEETKSKLAALGIDLEEFIREYSESTEGAYTLPE